MRPHASKDGGNGCSGDDPAPAETIPRSPCACAGEYGEMPGLRLTVAQAARLFGVAPDVVRDVLDGLRRTSVLTCSDRGTYTLNR